MTKSEFVKVLAKKLNMSQDKTKEFLNATLDTIVEVVKSGDKVLFTDFGSFYVSNRAQRKGRDPQTGKAITIPAFKLPAFKTGAPFKNALNEQPKPKKENKEQEKQKVVVKEDENLKRFYENQDTNTAKTKQTRKAKNKS
jgi:DNA-binding protein HU-beta